MFNEVSESTLMIGGLFLIGRQVTLDKRRLQHLHHHNSSSSSSSSSGRGSC